MDFPVYILLFILDSTHHMHQIYEKTEYIS